jgi:hypothetical protein
MKDKTGGDKRSEGEEGRRRDRARKREVQGRTTATEDKTGYQNTGKGKLTNRFDDEG